jgi:hypothetical protein
MDAELLGLIQSFMKLVARQAPADQARILCDCHAAMALFERTRKEDFDPMQKVQGRGAILQLFLSTQVPLSPATDFKLGWLQGHSDKLKPDQIAEADRPLFQAHVLCDKTAPKSAEIAARKGITFFEIDFQSVLCDMQGERVLQPFKALMKGLSTDPDYHARMTITHREHVTGVSWRDVPIAELHLPRTHTAWN